MSGIPEGLAVQLKRIADHINPSVMHPNDMQHIGEWLGEGIQGLEGPVHPDDVSAYLKSLGKLGPETIQSITFTYEAMYGFLNRRTPY